MGTMGGSFLSEESARRANLWLLYLKGPAFSIVVKSFQQVIQKKGVPLEIAGGKAVKGLTDFIKPYF